MLFSEADLILLFRIFSRGKKRTEKGGIRPRGRIQFLSKIERWRRLRGLTLIGRQSRFQLNPRPCIALQETATLAGYALRPDVVETLDSL
jgi:hypothetical protein